MSGDQQARHFLDLLKRSREGRFKIYIGMSAGVGKTFRMLQEAHALYANGADIRIGYIETHNRKETRMLVDGIPEIPRKQVFYKGKLLEEMDIQTILLEHPEIVIVDELAHTNMPGSKNEKRWQDVFELLAAGINVISAVNIQHLESLNDEVKKITGIEVTERIPDRVLSRADEVVNIDLTADELITRLKEGKIYSQEKINQALQHFFTQDNILRLRELALKEVASQVERKVERGTLKPDELKQERFMACISSNEKTARTVIRKTARLANYYQCKWFILYVQTPKENSDAISLARQRHLINNFKLASELGAEVLKKEGTSIAETIFKIAGEMQVTTICVGRPRFSFFRLIANAGVLHSLLRKLKPTRIDVVILA